MIKQIICLMPLLIIFLFSTCERNLSPMDEYQLWLMEESVGCRDVWLRLGGNKLPERAKYSIERDGREIISGVLKRREEIIIDTVQLEPGRSYSYCAYLLGINNWKSTASNKVNITTLDTTSHDFSWQVDTLGIYGSSLRDVAVIDENNVWAVGGLYLEEDGDLYNGIHWNGTEYEYLKIPIKISLDSEETYPNALYSIFAIDSNDIWAGSLGVLVHYDGSNWGDLHFISGGKMNKLWGTSSNNIWGVGDFGNILHYDGTSWQRLESPTTEDLHDITGLIDERTGELRL
jgi:hypothetical protein